MFPLLLPMRRRFWHCHRCCLHTAPVPIIQHNLSSTLMPLCQSGSRPQSPPALVVINGISRSSTQAVSQALLKSVGGVLHDASALYMPDQLDPSHLIANAVGLHRERHMAVSAYESVKARGTAIVPVADPHESFALAARTSRRLRDQPVPIVSVLVFTPLADLAAQVTKNLAQSPPEGPQALHRLAEYPLLYKAQATRPKQYLEYLTDSQLRRILTRLRAHVRTNTDGAALELLHAFLRATLGLSDGGRGVYIVPRSPIYDVHINAARPLKTGCAAVARAMQRPGHASRLVDAVWAATGGGAMLCPDCFRAVADASLAALVEPNVLLRSGRPLCGRCLDNQAALLSGEPAPHVGYRVPRFSGLFRLEGSDAGEAAPASVPPASAPGLAHAGSECWAECHRRSGPCRWCGTGKCCRGKWNGGEGGCLPTEGGDDKHVCVPGMPRAPPATPHPPSLRGHWARRAQAGATAAHHGATGTQCLF